MDLITFVNGGHTLLWQQLAVKLPDEYMSQYIGSNLPSTHSFFNGHFYLWLERQLDTL